MPLELPCRSSISYERVGHLGKSPCVKRFFTDAFMGEGGGKHQPNRLGGCGEGELGGKYKLKRLGRGHPTNEGTGAKV